MGLEFLGAIPLHPQVRIGGDSGRPVVAEQPDSEYARVFTTSAGRLAQRVSILAATAAGDAPTVASPGPVAAR